MPDLAKTVTTRELQRRIRETMRNAPSFRIDGDIPDDLKRRLVEIDRTVARGTPERWRRSEGHGIDHVPRSS